MYVTQPRIFINYSRTDSAFVDQLEADLQQNGYNTWVDRRKLEGGQSWLDELQQAIDQCQMVLVVLSPNATQSEYVLMEYRYAKDQGKLIIPLEYRLTPRVPIDLHNIQRIIFTNHYNQGLQNLLQALRHFSGPVVVPPPVAPPYVQPQPGVQNVTFTAPTPQQTPQRRGLFTRIPHALAFFGGLAIEISDFMWIVLIGLPGANNRYLVNSNLVLSILSILLFFLILASLGILVAMNLISMARLKRWGWFTGLLVY